ncbi:class IIb bacteriocin, lactobin A/cerein 7B family [Thiospirochaeta perfilievii]|uniref:Class IIb bacteriocin, lactobin A/cerein 7B family n=1 Tax=Thiospirochaeta perfilievii TaxID=252967 RepID=A0A5C1Q891_9SPIO|nr:class IIb bacteriocin, lactobin A/cerein 7B family [Thiospirochaeta perfilievii]MBN2617877.1 class IIb bacteriocin, lactobin A/cerein 7B family [Spirochaetales bacterium]QEN03558.1 class IIb bacteriocin, lactobin A/cerein 7B family [Thiospirochaeta perfilievii]
MKNFKGFTELTEEDSQRVNGGIAPLAVIGLILTAAAIYDAGKSFVAGYKDGREGINTHNR